MLKKALVTLMASAVLVITTASGGFINSTVTYAAEAKTIKITRDDCINLIEMDNTFDTVSKDIYRVDGLDGYFFGIPEYNEDGVFLIYPLPSLSSGSSVVIEVDIGLYGRCAKYTVSYDGSSYSITDKKTADEVERDKYNKMIEDMVVCKHQSAGNVTLSASEKKGTLVVTKADITTATKLDKMLKSKKALVIKVKASSRAKAVSRFKSLRKLTGHANTYGVQPWIDSYRGIPYIEKVSAFMFKKSGGYYTVSISKSISKNYSYLTEAYANAFKRAEKRKTDYTFSEGTHLCDCSDVAKLRMVMELIRHNHRHKENASWAKKKLAFKDEFRVLAGNDKYGVYVCSGLANLAREIGYASGITSTKGSKLNHAWAQFKVKGGDNKIHKVALDNGFFGISSSPKCTDGIAMHKIMGYAGATTSGIRPETKEWLNK